MFEKYNQQQLDAAFKLVQPKTHWKDRIKAKIKHEDQDIVMDAVIHFTGTVPSFKKNKDGTLTVTALGYRAGPCGDH